MEILERGQLPEEKTYEATCNHCKSRIRFTQTEAKVTSDQYEGDFVFVIHRSEIGRRPYLVVAMDTIAFLVAAGDWSYLAGYFWNYRRYEQAS